MSKHVGFLTFYFETGSEGLVWVLREDGKKENYGLVPIEAGDHLTVYDADGSVLFDDTIQIDNQTGRLPHPRNPQYKQQAALGWWIHWIQQGWRLDDWASLFLRGKEFPNRPNELRAELIKP